MEHKYTLERLGFAADDKIVMQHSLEDFDLIVIRDMDCEEPHYYGVIVESANIIAMLSGNDWYRVRSKVIAKLAEILAEDD